VEDPTGRLFRATMGLVGLFGKDKKQNQGGDWIQPGQIVSPLDAQGGPPGAGRPTGTAGPPVPVRLRVLDGAGRADWLNGALLLTPGSMLWQPDTGVSAEAVELATATILPSGPVAGKRAMMVTDVETAAGRFQLEMDAELVQMTQLLVAEAAPPDGPADP
jgi:hypothetical protein